MPSTPENRKSEKGMARASGHPKSVAQDEGHAGERGHQSGVVFKIPSGHPDLSCVKTPQHK